MLPLRFVVRAALALPVFAVGLVLTSCDLASAGGTAILNANSAVPPTVRHRFEYERTDATQDGIVEVTSEIEAETLDDVLADNGFARSDVVSARIDSVEVVPITAPPPAEATLHLGSDDSGLQIARVTFSEEAPTPAVDRSGQLVTGTVRSGTSKVFARFQAGAPRAIPEGGGVVRALVYYRLEVEGV